MAKFLKTFLVGMGLSVGIGYSSLINAQVYEQYCNNRYGFCVQYPQHFGIESAPMNNDGRRFYNHNGFIMIASGINNVMDDTLQSELESAKNKFDAITYQTTGNNWFVLSGYQTGYIIYIKTYIGEGSINHLYIQYPMARKEEYDKIVTTISHSFKSGDIQIAH